MRDERDLTVLLLAGGRSEKLEKLSGGVQKTFIEILGRPIIEHVINGLKDSIQSRIRRIILVSDRRDLAEPLASRYNDSRVVFVEQREHGVSGAYRAGFDLVDERDRIVLVVYGDIVADKNVYSSILLAGEDYLGKDDFGGIFLGVAEKPRKNHWLMDVDESGIVREIMPSTIRGYGYIAGGIYLVRNSFSRYLRDHSDIASAFREYVKDFKVRILPWGHYWVDIGSPWDLLEASYRILSTLRSSSISRSSRISPHAVIEGPVIIDEEAEIDHNVIIRGPAYIGRRAFIGAYSFIRSYSSIERNVFISSYSEINRSVILPEATIGRGCYIGYSVIGFGSVVEPGVITKNILQQRVEEAMRIVSRGREYSKLGSIIYSKARVYAGRILEAGEEVEID
ncbi:MAG: sugar phosphate nucleotidyltransferase [Sulfolobales archaeon]